LTASLLMTSLKVGVVATEAGLVLGDLRSTELQTKSKFPQDLAAAAAEDLKQAGFALERSFADVLGKVVMERTVSDSPAGRPDNVQQTA
jgi:hypothetical protein